MTKNEANWKQAFETVAKVAMHGGPMGILLEGKIYELPTLQPVSGVWYFALKCPTCQRPTPIFEDPAAGQFLTTYAGNGQVRTRCFHCEVKMILPPTAIHRLQWP